jgi:hypothetical protein
MTRHLYVALLAGLAGLAAPVARSEEPAGLPPPAPGREVVFDSRVMATRPGERSLTLSDIDPETAEIVREINSKPGTWQIYLLYTAEDLPERMFHPGFAIRLPERRRPVPPDLPPEALEADRPRAAEPSPAVAPAATPPATVTPAAPAPRR